MEVALSRKEKVYSDSLQHPHFCFCQILSEFCCCSVPMSYLTLCDPLSCSTPGFPLLYYSEFAQTHVCCVYDAIQPSHSLLPPSPPTLSLSQHQSFPVRWLFVSGGQSWSFSFSISPLSEYSGWISFRIDSFDLLAVQGTLKSLL